MISELGGYFELELGKHNSLHRDGLFLNSARNCLKHILIQKNISKVYLPYYTCEVLLEPIRDTNIEFEFYSINEQLDPIIDFEPNPNSALIIINYFGIKTKTIEALSTLHKNIVVDNSQALFCDPIPNTHCIYSPRKFIGMPDGGILFSDAKNVAYDRDDSVERCSHLLKRLDRTAQNGYPDFSANDAALSGMPIKRISNLSKAIYDNAHLDFYRERREMNFSYLHNVLHSQNELKITDSICGPMVYPFLTKNGMALKQKLIDQNIYVATYWNNILPFVKKDSLESYLIHNLVPLPIDQRLNTFDLDRILKAVQS